MRQLRKQRGFGVRRSSLCLSPLTDEQECLTYTAHARHAGLPAGLRCCKVRPWILGRGYSAELWMCYRDVSNCQTKLKELLASGREPWDKDTELVRQRCVLPFRVTITQCAFQIAQSIPAAPIQLSVRASVEEGRHTHVARYLSRIDIGVQGPPSRAR